MKRSLAVGLSGAVLVLATLCLGWAWAQDADDPLPPDLPAIELPEFEAEGAPKNDLLRALDEARESEELFPPRDPPPAKNRPRRGVFRTGPPDGRTPDVVASALDWLKRHQMRDGSWSFNHGLSPKCGAKCRNPGELPEARNAATGLALLAYLGAGQTHQDGKYNKQVKKGLDYLIDKMKVGPNGASLAETGGTMYSHGIAALALSEAYAMTADKKLMAPAQQAVDFVSYAQDPVGGGWRYMPRQKGDLSVTGWQLAVLKSAHGAYLRVPPETVKKALGFLDSVQADEGAAYGYTQPGHGQATSAMGLLYRLSLGWDKDNAAFKRGVERIADQGPSKSNMYYNYYAQQVLHQAGGDHLAEWNNQMRAYLAESQATEGHEAGSWYFTGADHGTQRGGRLYSTAMAVMILEVYYRHLPIYERPAESLLTEE